MYLDGSTTPESAAVCSTARASFLISSFKLSSLPNVALREEATDVGVDAFDVSSESCKRGDNIQCNARMFVSYPPNFVSYLHQQQKNWRLTLEL